MKNKKGFTLIELLAVIVILAIIMVIAVPKILKVIDSSRESAWTNNARLVKKAIETNSKIIDFETNEARTSPKLLCNNETSSEVDVTSNLSRYVKVGDMDIKCKKDENYIFRLIGKNQFSGRQAIINCTLDGICSITSISNNQNTNIVEPVSFSSDSWETIAANTTSTKYHVGDEKVVNMDVDGDNTKEEYHVMIVNKNPCTTQTSQSACGMVLQFKEQLHITDNNKKKMNPKGEYKGVQYNYGWNVDGWSATAMRAYLNNGTDSIYAKLKSEIGDIIIDTIVVSGDGNTTEETNITTTDKLYLLSTKEVGLNVSYDSVKSATRKLDYYLEGTTSEANALRSHTNLSWWLRSARTNTNTHFIVVTSGGSYSTYDAFYSNGVIPAFRIGTNN